MNYGPGRRTPSVGTPSVYSHVTSRSTANLRSSRSLKSLKIPWYRRPILQDAYFLDIQRGSLIVACYSFILSLFTIGTAIFDMYCLWMAAPGSTHYGYYIISYQFVYVGSTWVRNLLILLSLFSFVVGVMIFVTSTILINALRKEHEKRVVPWLYTFAAFTIFRFVAWVFVSIVNDPIFFYNYTMIMLWGCFTVLNVYGWILVYSLYLELSDLSKLEDLAHLRFPFHIKRNQDTQPKEIEEASMGTMQSLNASTTHSLAGSRPTTPHSTISTAPAV